MKTINNVPNISDHEGAILVDSSIKPLYEYNEEKTQTYLLMSSAEGPAFKEEVAWFTTALLHLDRKHLAPPSLHLDVHPESIILGLLSFMSHFHVLLPGHCQFH